MQIKIRVETTGLQKKFDLLVDATKDLKLPLREFGAHLRKKAGSKFQSGGPGWPKLADATEQKIAHTRTHRITARGTVRRSAQLALQRKVRREVSKGLGGQGAEAELRALFDRHASGQTASIQRELRETLKESENKTVERLRKDLERYDERSAKQRRGGARKKAKHKLLGKLSSSLRSIVARNTLVVFSKVPWAGVHNAGGTAGRGVSIPKREFLALDEDDVKVLATLLEARMVEAFEGSDGDA